MSTVREKTTCRLCDALFTTSPVLSLPATPPANEFVPAPALQDHFPLELMLCAACGHVQLKHVVAPERLFRNYVYTSGGNVTAQKHFKTLAAVTIARLGLRPSDLVVELGSNDGALLVCYQECGLTVLGVDPAVKIAAAASSRGVRTLPVFFDEATVDKILRMELAPGRKAALVVANNVFAHADDLHGIVKAVKQLLAPGGTFVFEAQYLGDLVSKGLFDMIYAEHLSFHSVEPLVNFFARHRMCLLDVERIDTHGGSIRCFVGDQPGLIGERVLDLIEYERALRLGYTSTYMELGERIQERRSELRELLLEKIGSDTRVVGYGAPAKLTTLLYALDLPGERFAYVVDDSPWKQGLYTPGKHIPVVPFSRLFESKPKYVVIFAWNMAGPLIDKIKVAFLERGTAPPRCIVPLPNVRIA